MCSFLLPLLLLLRLELSRAWLENCPCSSIPKSASCPFNRDCDSSQVVDANCTLKCGDGHQLMYRTGIPWRSTASLSCSPDGRHQPATGSALGASVAAIACAAPSKCTNCSPPIVDDGVCPTDYVCMPGALKITTTEDGCAVASCTWGELMTIDAMTGLPTGTFTVPHPAHSAIQQAPPEAQQPAMLRPFAPISETISTTSTAPTPGSTTTGMPITSSVSALILKDMIPKRDEEYHDSEEVPAKATLPSISSSTMAPSSAAISVAATKTSVDTTTEGPKLDLFGRPITSKNRGDADLNDPITARMNGLGGFKKKAKEDDYDYEEFSSSPSSFLARMRRGVYSFISRQTRRLERHIFGFSEEATSHSITLDKTSGADKLVNRVIGKATSPSPAFAQLPWDDFEDDDEQIRTLTTTTKKPETGRIVGKIGAPQAPNPTGKPSASDWFHSLFEKRTTTTKKAPAQTMQQFIDRQFAGKIGEDWLEDDQMLVRDNVKHPVFVIQPTTTISTQTTMTTGVATAAAATTTAAPEKSGSMTPAAAATTESTTRVTSTTAVLTTPSTTVPSATAVASTATASLKKESPTNNNTMESSKMEMLSAPTANTSTAPTTTTTSAGVANTTETSGMKLTAAAADAIPVVTANRTTIETANAAAPSLLVPSIAPAALLAASVPDSHLASAPVIMSKKTPAEAIVPQAAPIAPPANLGIPAKAAAHAASEPAATSASAVTPPTTRRVVEEAPRVTPHVESPIDEIGLMTLSKTDFASSSPTLLGQMPEGAEGISRTLPTSPHVEQRGKEAPMKEDDPTLSGAGVDPLPPPSSPIGQNARSDISSPPTGKGLPVIDGEAVVPANVKAGPAHTVDFDSTSPRQPWGKNAASIPAVPQLAAAVPTTVNAAAIPEAAVLPSGGAVAAIAHPDSKMMPLTTAQPSLTLTRAGPLKCSGNGLWYDANFALRHVSRVTCARQKSCGTCSIPPLLQQCDERQECGSSKIVAVEAANGCVKGVCEDGESYIAVRDRATGKAVADITEMSCDPFGRWRSSMFDVIGDSIEAVCYRPKCKKCLLRELACPAGKYCDMSRLAEPEPAQRCYSLHCSEGARMLVLDDSGAVRTATKIDCSHGANWVLTEDGTGHEVNVTGAEAAVTCEYNPPPCQHCPFIKPSPECPGAKHRPCFPLSQKGGIAEKSCRLNTCEPGDELWVKLESGWTRPEKLSMLGCAGDQGWIGNDGVTKLPLNAQAVCKRAPCDNCVAPTISAFCPDEHGEKGCDSFAMRRNGTRYDEKSGCTSIVCPNDGKIAFHNPATGSLVTATKQMHCVNGQWLTDIGEPVPPTLHVTCVDWRGTRTVCGNGGCTYSLEDPSLGAKMRYSEVGGCYELYCATGNILGFNPKYSSWEPANQGHFTCSDKGWKRAYGVVIPESEYRFHIRVKCQ